MNPYWQIEDFHGERNKGVGSSDTPVLAGLYKHYGKTSLTLWEEKTGRAEQWEGNERTRVGRDLEAYGLARFVEAQGLCNYQGFFGFAIRGESTGPFNLKTEARHPEYPFCLAHADLLVDEATYCPDCGQFSNDKKTHCEGCHSTDPYIVEAKTVGAYAAKRREGQIFSGYDLDDKSEQGIPDAVYLQAQWQLFCYGVKSAYVAALIDNEFHIWGPIHSNSKVQASCLALAERFWRLVQADEMPAPEAWDDLIKIYPSKKNETVTISGDDELKVKAMIQRFYEAKERIKRTEDEIEDIKLAMGVLIGENTVLSNADGDILAKCGEQTREHLSLGDLKLLPEIYNQLKPFVKKTTFRTLKIKGEK